jgi:hypothetical protein
VHASFSSIRSAARAAAVVVLLLGGGAGCAGTEEDGVRAEPPVPAPVADQRSYLYGLPDMKEAAFHREIANRHLERAYQLRNPDDRDLSFRNALVEYRTSRDLYYQAMSGAPRRYHPFIEAEVDTVSTYILRIQQDRPLLGGARFQRPDERDLRAVTTARKGL